MGNCKDCKHWQPSWAPTEGRGLCLELYKQHMVCVRDAANTQYVNANVETKAGFGCVLFEAKE